MNGSDLDRRALPRRLSKPLNPSLRLYFFARQLEFGHRPPAPYIPPTPSPAQVPYRFSRPVYHLLARAVCPTPATPLFPSPPTPTHIILGVRAVDP